MIPKEAVMDNFPTRYKHIGIHDDSESFKNAPLQHIMPQIIMKPDIEGFLPTLFIVYWAVAYPGIATKATTIKLKYLLPLKLTELSERP